MPKHPRLHRIGRRFYHRAKVPADLLAEYDGKKEVKTALGTSDPAEALRLVRIAAVEFDRDNEIKRAIRAGTTTPVTDGQLNELAIAWLKERLYRNELSYLAPNASWSEAEVEQQRQDAQYEEALYVEALATNDFNEIFSIADRWLERHGVILDHQDVQYRKFCRLMLRASLENTRRFLAQVQGQLGVTSFDGLFCGVDGGSRSSSSPSTALQPVATPTVASQVNGLTFAEAAAKYLERPSARALSLKSLEKDRAAFDLIAAILGKTKPLASVTSDDCLAVHAVFAKLPPNYTKRFPKLTPLEMAERATKEGLAPMSVETQRSYLTRLKKVFAYALKADWIPRDSSAIVELPRDDVPPEEKRYPFTVAQLRTVFDSPLYTGCLDDERGAAKPGLSVIRRGRFWIPILSLWTGMRLNECCQLTVDDVAQEDGVWVIRIRPNEEEGKRVKSTAGRRVMPIHPELERIGFMAFVEAQRKAGHARLFPELPADATGYYSSPFSKWFARYLDKIGIKDRKITFHSFRHTFADALREADISPERQDVLGGWSSGASTRRVYGKGLSVATLYEEVSKVRYPGLDLAHLFSRNHSENIEE